MQAKYQNLIEITRILTNDCQKLVSDATSMVNDFKSFCLMNSQWLFEENLDYFDVSEFDDLSYQDEILLDVFIRRLTSYESDNNFGSSVDCNASLEDILWSLEGNIEKLDYHLDIGRITSDEEWYGYDALRIIHSHFAEQEYSLVGLDDGSDTYHLFISPADRFKEVEALGAALSFDFFQFPDMT